MAYQPKHIKKNNRVVEQTYILDEIELSDDDIYISSNPTVPLTHIAQDYYDNSSMWRVIAKVNNVSSIFVTDGRTLRIPINPTIKFKKD